MKGDINLSLRYLELDLRGRDTLRYLESEFRRRDKSTELTRRQKRVLLQCCFDWSGLKITRSKFIFMFDDLDWSLSDAFGV